MKLANLPFLLAVASRAFAASDADEETPADSKVAVLDIETFPDFIAENNLVLAEFYAPWCGHCKKLAPEYEEAAAYLAENEEGIALAKVDCTDNKDLCMEYEIQGFPTLIIFDNGVPTGQYQGQRKAADIIKYMQKQAQPVVVELETAAEVEAWLEKNHEANPTVVLHLGSEESKGPLANLAKRMRDTISFISSTDKSLKKKYGSDLVVLKLDEEPEVIDADTELTPAAIESFVKLNQFASFEELGPENYAAYIESGIPMLYGFVGDDSSRELIKDAVKPFLKELKAKANIVFLDSNLYGRHASNLNMEQKFPALVVHDTTSNKKYIHDQSIDVTEESIAEFIKDFLGGNIVANMKSEPVPETQEGPVYVLVGTEYDKVVLDDDKDVLVEFYAPWCGHCKSLAPIYEELAELYETNDNVVIAKVDHTENEVPDKITGYPTIKLFPAGDKENPIVFDGSRDLDSFVKFIREKGTHKAEPESSDKDAKKKVDDKDEL